MEVCRALEIQCWVPEYERILTEASYIGVGWSLNEGDGAFYGPKIDIKGE